MTQTFKVLIGLTLVVLLAFLIVGSTRAAEEPQIVHVTLQDNRVEMSQTVVAPGKAVTFVVANSSSMPHQFIIEPYATAGASPTGNEPVIAPGTIWTIQQTFTSGVYRVACTNQDHVQRGLATAIAADALTRVAVPLRMDFWIPILTLVFGTGYVLADSLGLRVTRE